MRHRPVPVLAAATLLLSGCTPSPWLGYRAPGPGDFVDVAPDLPYCMEVGVQNLTERQRDAVVAAARDVCAIFVSPAFEEGLAGRDFLASCDARRDGSDDVIAGADLAPGFLAVPDFSVHPRKPGDAASRAYSEFSGGWGDDRPDVRIAIDPTRIEAWYDDDPATRALLVNTLAREITHIDSSRFRDEGLGSARCPAGRLASHAVGDLAARLWLERLRAGSR